MSTIRIQLPWIRVKLSCAIGDGLYPHPQWAKSGEAVGEPTTRLPVSMTSAGTCSPAWKKSLPEFVAVLINHRPKALRGRSLREAMNVEQRAPARLDGALRRVEQGAEADVRAPPSLVFAVLGQAKADGGLSPEDESDLLAKLLTFWAMRSTLDASAACLPPPRRISTTPSLPLS